MKTDQNSFAITIPNDTKIKVKFSSFLAEFLGLHVWYVSVEVSVLTVVNESNKLSNVLQLSVEQQNTLVEGAV